MVSRRWNRIAAVVLIAGLALSGSFTGTGSGSVSAQAHPNIVLMFPDNLGWGEVGVYGSVRGVPTPSSSRRPGPARSQ